MLWPTEDPPVEVMSASQKRVWAGSSGHVNGAPDSAY